MKSRHQGICRNALNLDIRKRHQSNEGRVIEVLAHHDASILTYHDASILTYEFLVIFSSAVRVSVAIPVVMTY